MLFLHLLAFLLSPSTLSPLRYMTFIIRSFSVSQDRSGIQAFYFPADVFIPPFRSDGSGGNPVSASVSDF
jgi:hypothetical protein